MKIALIGYGKMGHVIEEVARSRGHEIVSIIDLHNRADMDSDAFRSADVAIEFSVPAAGLQNVLDAMKRGVKVVSGTTGWYKGDALQAIDSAVAEGGTLLASSNFSIGVNVTMAVSRLLARLLAPYKQYSPSMTEVHHIHKIDHPSGTAITLAEDIIKELHLEGFKEVPSGQSAPAGFLPITALREGEVPGIHTIEWSSPDDDITLTHSAHSRHGFATGAVVAAEWLAKAQSGRIYNMSDVLSL